jgi:fibronectin-binding autotransporter adhesin
MKTQSPCFNKPLAILSLKIIACISLAVAALNCKAGTDTWVGNNDVNWSNTNNWSPVTLTGPVANDQLSFTSAGTAGAVLNDDLTAGLTFNGITFQSGGDAFTLYGNSIGLNGGITNNGANTEVISNNIILQANGAVNATGPVTLAGAVGGAFNLAKVGTGTLTLVNGGNSYGGNTVINAGTVKAAVTGALPSIAKVVFTGATAATLDIQGTAQTPANMTFTNIGASTITIAGTGGTLNVSPSSLTISPFATTNSLTVNMAGLGSFVYNNVIGTFSVQNGVFGVINSTGQSITTLAATNAINAATIGVGTFNPSGGTVSSILNLGASNQLTVAALNLGNGRAGGTIQFATGLTSPTLSITGTNGGSGLTTLAFGKHDSFQVSDKPVDLLDTTAGTLNVQFGSVNIGHTGPGSSMTGNRFITSTSTFKMGAGMITASNMLLGYIDSAAGDTGSFNYSITNNSVFSIASGGTAVITNLTLANNNYSGNLTANSVLSATLILTNGATLDAASIQEGSIATPNSGVLNVTSQLTWGDGTIGNIAGGDLSIAGVSVVLVGTSTTHNFNIAAGQNAAVNSIISGSGGLTVAGAGTVTLSGANTYTGNTTVNNGTLVLSGAGSLASAAINVTSNAVFDVSPLGTFYLATGGNQTLTGLGGINGSVYGFPGAQIVPGSAGLAGTLTFSNDLTLDGSLLTFGLPADVTGSNDVINVGGTLTLNADTSVAVNELAGSLGNGTYTLMTYGALNTNGFSFTLIAPRGVTLNVGPNALTLTISGSASGNLTWVGDAIANNWDAQITTNWLNAGNLDYFYQNDSVTFDDTGSATPAVNLTTTLYPGSVTVSASQDYTFSGSGQLSGGMTLTKSGTGTLYLHTTNTYTGGTIVSNGTVELDNVSAASTGAISLDAGVLVVNIAGKTLTNAVSGPGTINVIESGGLATAFGGSLSNFSGTINIPGNASSSSKVAITTSAVNINSNATINIAGGGTLFLSGGSVVVAATNNVSGYGNKENYGALRVDSSSTVSGPVNLLGDTAIGEAGSGSGTISGVISDGGNGYGIVKVGGATSTLILAGPNTYSGITTVSNGTVQVGNGISNGDLLGDVALATNNATLSFVVASNTTVTYNGVISGNGSLAVGTSSGGGIAGTLVLNGMNTFTNNVVINAGALWITNAAALGTGPKQLSVVNGNTGHCQLHLNGVSGDIVLPSTISLFTSLNTGVIFNEAGNNEIDGTITLYSGGNGSYILANAGTLTLAGNIFPVTTGRDLRLGGAGNGIVTGVIADGSGTNLLTDVSKRDAGTWTLAATNTSASTTTVMGGTLLVNGIIGTNTVTVQDSAILGGTGVINGATVVQTNGTLSPGAAGIGTLTVGNNLTVNGNLYFELNKSLAQSNDYVVVTGTLANSGSGTLTLTNLGPALAVGDAFKLFSEPMSSASTLTLQPSPGTGLAWSNSLAVDGNVYVVNAATVNTNSPVLADSISGNTLTLSWPADHLGWKLQVQTNALSSGLGTNWFTVPGSDGVTSTNLTIDSANPTVFFRLVYP